MARSPAMRNHALPATAGPEGTGAASRPGELPASPPAARGAARPPAPAAPPDPAPPDAGLAPPDAGPAARAGGAAARRPPPVWSGAADLPLDPEEDHLGRARMVVLAALFGMVFWVCVGVLLL